MLIELDIAAWKLLSGLRLQFGPGMTALTGETGVGKSMVLGALGFLLGDKAGEEAIPQGQDEVRVSALWQLDPVRPEVQALISEGLWDPAEDPEFLIERTLARGGRSRASLNGRRCSQAVLQQIGTLLVDVLGQNQTRYLTRIDPADLLDSLGDTEHHALREAMAAAFQEWRKARKALAEARSTTGEDRRGFLDYQWQELGSAKLHEGEEAALTAEHQRLASVGTLREAAQAAAELLLEGAGGAAAVYDQLAQVQGHVEAIAQRDADWQHAAADLAGMLEQLQEQGLALQQYAAHLEADPARLEALERRIAQLEGLKRKYRTDYAGLITLREAVRQERAALDSADERIAALEAAERSARKRAGDAAAALHDSRVALAPAVADRLRGHLADLNLSQARVEFAIERDPAHITRSGADQVKLLLATAAREPLRPFAEIASGGEVTRLALAFKALRAWPPNQSLMVVDEGDLGIGGDTAFQVGAKFHALSQHQQLLIVSHLPQVAAYADRHYAVRRDQSSGIVTVEPVAGEARTAELARMLGDRLDPGAARELAASFLREAQVG